MKKRPKSQLNKLPEKNFLKMCLHGMDLAMYIVGQERRLVDPPSQWLLG